MSPRLKCALDEPISRSYARGIAHLCKLDNAFGQTMGAGTAPSDRPDKDALRQSTPAQISKPSPTDKDLWATPKCPVL
jgi:hypothetical protein